jgi:transposase InsO family protein
MESFFHTLEVELVHQRRWATRDEARRDLFAYIEDYCNRQRIHSALGYITPEQAERKASQPPVSAKSGEDESDRRYHCCRSKACNGTKGG